MFWIPDPFPALPKNLPCFSFLTFFVQAVLALRLSFLGGQGIAGGASGWRPVSRRWTKEKDSPERRLGLCWQEEMTHFSSEKFQRKYNDRMMSEEQVETGTLIEVLEGGVGLYGCQGRQEMIDWHRSQESSPVFSVPFSRAPVWAEPSEHVVKSVPVLGVLVLYLGETLHPIPVMDVFHMQCGVHQLHDSQGLCLRTENHMLIVA